jgi:hypothetical protein
MIPQTSNSGQSSQKGQGKWKLDAGWATVISAAIGAVALIAVAFFAGTNVPASTSMSSSPSASRSPVSVTINPPLTGDISHLDSYSGNAINLAPGQLIWTFNQSVNGKTGSISPRTYPDTGPCLIDYSKQTWTCSNIYVGNVNDTGIYHVCVAVLTAPDAFAVVSLLRNTLANASTGYKFWLSSPPYYIHDNTSACMSVHRTNGP